MHVDAAIDDATVSSTDVTSAERIVSEEHVGRRPARTPIKLRTRAYLGYRIGIRHRRFHGPDSSSSTECLHYGTALDVHDMKVRRRAETK